MMNLFTKQPIISLMFIFLLTSIGFGMRLSLTKDIQISRDTMIAEQLSKGISRLNKIRPTKQNHNTYFFKDTYNNSGHVVKCELYSSNLNEPQVLDFLCRKGSLLRVDNTYKPHYIYQGVEITVTETYKGYTLLSFFAPGSVYSEDAISDLNNPPARRLNPPVIPCKTEEK